MSVRIRQHRELRTPPESLRRIMRRCGFIRIWMLRRLSGHLQSVIRYSRSRFLWESDRTMCCPCRFSRSLQQERSSCSRTSHIPFTMSGRISTGFRIPWFLFGRTLRSIRRTIFRTLLPLQERARRSAGLFFRIPMHPRESSFLWRRLNALSPQTVTRSSLWMRPMSISERPRRFL